MSDLICQLIDQFSSRRITHRIIIDRPNRLVFRHHRLLLPEEKGEKQIFIKLINRLRNISAVIYASQPPPSPVKSAAPPQLTQISEPPPKDPQDEMALWAAPPEQNADNFLALFADNRPPDSPQVLPNFQYLID